MKQRLHIPILIIVLYLFTESVGLAQTVRYVSATGTNTIPSWATSWASSTTDLQGVISISVPGDQIWVSGGVYKPTTTTGPASRSISFTIKPGVAMYGGFVGTETALSQRPAVNPNTGMPSSSTLSGDIGAVGDVSDNSYHVVRSALGTNSTASLDGFVIAAGNANGQGNDASGGGIDNAPLSAGSQSAICSPAIRNCMFYRNRALSGGGISIITRDYNLTVSPSLSGCLFLENIAETGGAVYVGNSTFSGSSPTFTDCVFRSNSATSGGVITGVAGGSATTRITFTNSRFGNNTATSGGGVAYFSTGRAGTAGAAFINSEFDGNSSYDGGVLWSAHSAFGSGASSFINCSFRNNSASNFGGIAYVWAESLVLPFAYLTNSIIWDNQAGNTFYQGQGARISVKYSLLQPTVVNYVNDTGNITSSTSPFTSTTNLQLSPCSPAINAGSNTAVASLSLTTDLAGNPRFYNGGTIDMGAYEYQGNVPAPVNITGQPVGTLNTCQGSITSASVSASGATTGYQWYRNGTALTNQTSATLSFPNAATANTGTYAVAVVGQCNSVTSTNTNLVVNQVPTKPVATSLSLCQYQASSSLSATASANATLRWYATNATGGTASTIAPNPATDKSGTFRYYVAQLSENNCESERAEVTVEVKEASPAPAVTGVTYCAGAPAAALAAVASSGGGVLSWYAAATGGTGTAVGPTPSTANPGAQTYFVTQSINGACESQRVPLTVTVNATPAAPSVGNGLVYCQNVPVGALSATGQNLRWYTEATGGTSQAGITPKTDAPGTFTYYVSQSLDGCEGPRAALPVTVKALPAAPGVTKVDLCQFAQAKPLEATGSGLTWYDPDGKVIGNTGPTPVTDRGTTFAYQVSQTADGCTGPKATLTVTIMATPLPVLAKTVLELCKGSTAAPLEATGTNLKWTDPTGATSTTAPVPFTTEPTKNPDGDAYYVTQTGANGCESPRALIRVFVQGPPTLALTGATTVNLGVEAPISLKFTGVGPYRYKISAGTSLSLVGSAVKDTTILVLPTRTTVYQVTEVSNRCGVGLPVSTATVMVTVPTIQTQSLASTTVCAGSTLTTSFLTTGQFNPGSVFRLQLARTDADTTQIQYADLPNMQVIGGQISASIPLTATADTYLVRVVATNPKIPILGTPSISTLSIRSLPGASLAASQNAIYEGEAVKLSVSFTGDGPWTFSYRDSSSVDKVTREITTNANPHVLDLRPQKTTIYRLTALSNGCGTSLSLPASVGVTVNPLLAVEPLAELIKVFPVPVMSTVTVQIDPVLMTEKATLMLLNAKGHTTLKQETHQPGTLLRLDDQPAGVYILQVRIGEHIITRRLIKQ